MTYDAWRPVVGVTRPAMADDGEAFRVVDVDHERKTVTIAGKDDADPNQRVIYRDDCKRSAFCALLEQELEAALRRGDALAAVLAHVVGARDRLLQEAEMLRRVVRAARAVVRNPLVDPIELERALARLDAEERPATGEG